ncbi:MAG: hypothetical protein WC943_11875 [Elusimicrobiota bacterium]|jgi:hypothetical protein
MDKKIPPPELELPDFKLKKVGKDRERRKVGLPWFPQMGRGAQTALATGGNAARAGIFSAFLGSKIGILLMTAALSAGAWGFGKMLADQGGDTSAGLSAPSTSSGKVQYEGDLANLPGAERGKSGLGMVSGSLSAPEPAEAVDAEEAPAADESASAGDVAAVGEAPAGEAPPAEAGEAAGEAAAAKAGAFGARPGALGSRPSGLSGGGGLSGGISRNFGATNKLKGGSIAAAKRAAAPKKTTIASTGIRNSMNRSLARRQLSRAQQFANASRRGGDENRSANSSSAFENNTPPGVSLTGAGAVEGAPAPEGTPDGSGGGGGSSGGGGDGSVADDPITCGSGTRLVNGTCVAKAKDADNASKIMGIVKILSMILFMLLLIQFLIKPTYLTVKVKKVLKVLILALSAGIFGCGIALMAMGRSDLGLITTLTGAIGIWAGWTGDMKTKELMIAFKWKGLALMLGLGATMMQKDSSSDMN